MVSLVVGVSLAAITGRTALLLLPLVVIEVGLVVFALVDLARPERRVLGGSKLLWVLVILLVGTFGPLVYLILGREES